MKQLAITNQAGMLDSREVALMIGKNHHDLLRDIRTYCDYLGESKIACSDFFSKSNYYSEQKKQLPSYQITRKGCELIAHKLTGEKGVLFTVKYIEKFHAMEQSLQPQIPQNFAQALRLAAELSEQNECKDQIIGELKPKADYVDLILLSVGAVTATQIAADYSISANKLNKMLNEQGVQRKVGKQWILYKEHMGLGYTKSETIHIVRTNGEPDTTMTTKWTQKGRLMINELLNEIGTYANVDKKPVKLLPAYQRRN